MSALDNGLTTLCGRTLETARMLEHLHGGTRSLVALWLGWSGGGIQLRTAPDGWGLAVDSVEPRPADLGEYGELELTDAVSPDLRLGRVIAVSAIVCSESPRPIGIRLQVEDAAPSVIYSYDDDLLVGDDVVSDLTIAGFEPICTG
jgi:hypothetical protein